MRALPGVCLLDRYLELSGAFFRIGKRTVRIFFGCNYFWSLVVFLGWCTSNGKGRDVISMDGHGS